MAQEKMHKLTYRQHKVIRKSKLDSIKTNALAATDAELGQRTLEKIKKTRPARSPNSAKVPPISDAPTRKEES